jgi:hypothetical protein
MKSWLRQLGVDLEPEDCPDLACRRRGTCPVVRVIPQVPEGALVELPCGAKVDRRERPSIETYRRTA